jgi:hypothetical protein
MRLKNQPQIEYTTPTTPLVLRVATFQSMNESKELAVIGYASIVQN